MVGQLGIGLGLGVGRPLGHTQSQGVGAGLSSLFANGEDGFLFYPMSDLTRLFLLSSGSTGNVAVDADPVGLDLDSSSWGNGISYSSLLAAQPELVPNPTLSGAVAGTPGTQPTGWAGLFSTGGAASVVMTQVALNTVSGIPCVDISDAGTASSSVGQAAAMGPSGMSGIPVVAGKSYTASCYFALLSGALGDAGGARLRIAWFTAAGAANGQTDIVLVGLSSSLAQFKQIAVAPAGSAFATLTLRVGVTIATAYSWTLRIGAPSLKLVPGNHALQATTTKRPLWKANGGKPYLNFDGTDDTLISPFLPTAAMTMACAFNSATAGGILIGGGDSAGGHWAYLSLSGSGVLSGGWGVQNLTTIFGGANVLNANHVGILVADAVSVDLYLDGAPIYTAAPSGSPSGGTGGMALASFNDAGTPSTFSNSEIFGAIALNRRATLAEIALITSKFQSAYQ